MFPFWISLRERLFDERFVLHRYKSTSHAGVAVALAIAGWAVHDQLLLGRIRWDLLALLGLMVVVKLGFMACLVALGATGSAVVLVTEGGRRST